MVTVGIETVHPSNEFNLKLFQSGYNLIYIFPKFIYGDLSIRCLQTSITMNDVCIVFDILRNYLCLHLCVELLQICVVNFLQEHRASNWGYVKKFVNTLNP